MLESYTRKKSMASLADELALRVDSVWVRRGDGNVKIALRDVTKEDVVVVHAGNAIPVDGIVVEGDGSVNQASMTGEPLPVHRMKGGTVFAGTVLEDGELMIRPTGVGDGTRLQQIVRFIENSEAAKAGIEGKALKWADRIVPYHFLLAGLVWLVTRDFARMASVLMVDFSCALRLATPLAILTAMRTGTQRGVVVKGGKYLEALAEVDTVVFDKTGTLTASAPKLSDVVSLDDRHDSDDLLRLAACLEEHFPHPVGRAVVHAAEAKGLAHTIEAHDAKIDYVVPTGSPPPSKGSAWCWALATSWRKTKGFRSKSGTRRPNASPAKENRFSISPSAGVSPVFSGSRIRSAKRRNPSSRHFTSAASRKSGC